MQESSQLFVLRHGQTAWNAEQRIQGQRDVPLDAAGECQAQRLARALAGVGISALYSSDLQRAQQTAAPLAALIALEPVLDRGLRERSFGSFEGCTYAEIEARWPEQALRWRQREPGFGPGGGEPLQAFYERSVQTVLRLAAAHPGQTVAVVAHGGVLDCLYRAAARIPMQGPRTWELRNAAINRLLWTPQGLALVGWNDCAHLDAGPTIV